MADQTDSLTCPICSEAYTATADPHDRRPTTFCKNGHTLCSTCANRNSLDKCPTCRESKALVLNRALLDVVAARLRQNSTPSNTGIPEISADHVRLAARPFTGGKYADVYDADEYAGVKYPMQLCKAVDEGLRPEMPKSFPTELRAVVERGWSADASARPTLADFREALRRLKTTTRDANATASASSNFSINAEVYEEFVAQLHTLEQSVKAYKLVDARSQVAACRRLWMRLDDPTKATASTARYHSVKGFVHHWFGECSDAYKETYQALTEMYELCLLGTSVEGEQVVTILRYAVQVCCLQDLDAAAAVLLRYAVRYAKRKLSATAYADVLEDFCCSYIRGKNGIKVLKFALSAKLQASVNIPPMNVAFAHYHLAHELFWEQSESDEACADALDQLRSAQRAINKVDPDNIFAALCKSLEGVLIRVTDQKNLEKAEQLEEDALAIAKRILGKNNKTVSEIYLELALVYKMMKRYGDAERMFEKAIKAADKSLGPNSIFVTDALEKLADMYTYKLNKYEEAEELYLRSIDIYKGVYGPGSRDLYRLYDGLAETYTKWRKTAKAATYSRLASEVESGRLEDKLKSTRVAIKRLLDEVLQSIEGGDEVSESPGQLVDVLPNFFEIAPRPF